ncbi:unnamed protein product [Angiostrongylus costaricensis]|uniref:PKD_channel domain-containing protein n=1 Tax=Angiostrongylus costaricensis TaxID=334426 RepID=A0A0R3PE67_ANGCS|nr:unnamed protein product [Angiostrongylus costaricensis]
MPLLSQNSARDQTIVSFVQDSISRGKEKKPLISKTEVPEPVNLDLFKPLISFVPPVVLSEIRHAVSSVKNRTAPGPYRIRAKHQKNPPPVFLNMLAWLLTRYLSECKVPTLWKTSKTVFLIKKGDLHDIGNYRPICLLCAVYKLFTRVILNRTDITLDEGHPFEQAQFPKRFSTVDHFGPAKIEAVILDSQGLPTQYGIAVSNNHVDRWLPFISDCGAVQPESSIFGFFLNVAAFFLLVTVYLIHRTTMQFYDANCRMDIGEWKWFSMVLMVVGWLATVGASVVANFQVDYQFITPQLLLYSPFSFWSI